MPIILSFTLSHLSTHDNDNVTTVIRQSLFTSKYLHCDELFIENDGSDPFGFAYLHYIRPRPFDRDELTHLPLVPHIYVNGVSIDSGNGLSPVRRQAITWTNPGVLRIGLMRINFSEIRIGILPFPVKKMHLEIPHATMVAILSRGGGLS